MLEAAGWAALAAATLVVGAAAGCALKASARTIGLVMAFGAGALIASVSFELTQHAFELAGGLTLTIGLALGALTFFTGNLLITRAGGGRRKQAHAEDAGTGAALFLGAVLDGIPESLIIGLSLLTGGGVELAFLVSVAVSNIPEGFASGAAQHRAGERTSVILARWTVVVAVAAVFGALGYALFDELPSQAAAVTEAFAAGALLTMVMDTMVPEAFRDAGPTTGLVAVAGFAFAFLLGTL